MCWGGSKGRGAGRLREVVLVIPGRAQREPGIQSCLLSLCIWIPDRRFAASGMTAQILSAACKAQGPDYRGILS